MPALLRRAGASWMLIAVACGGAADTPQPEASAPEGGAAVVADSTFWGALAAHCGNAYEGTVVEAPAGDTSFAGKQLVMHVRSCSDDEIRIPFHVGADRSRTWVLTRANDVVRLKHDHRHEDGAEDSITQYGGDSRSGLALRQEFPADAHTATLIPAAATNVWTVEVVPGRTFVYALRREGTDRRFRIEFDLSRPVTAPPAPWGATD
jgi:hypothetical protein